MTHKSQISAKWGPVDRLYWEHLDEAADMMAAAIMRPLVLNGGDPGLYHLVGRDVLRYTQLSTEVSAIFGARGIEDERCIDFLKTVAVADGIHIHEHYVEPWSSLRR